MLHKLRSRLTYANVMATTAVFVAIVGSAAVVQAVGTSPCQSPPGQACVGTADIIDSEVKTNDLQNLGVTNPKLAATSVTTGKLADSAVTNIKLANSAVTNAKLANNAVTTGKVLNNNLQGADLLDGTVATADLANGAVTPTKRSAAIGSTVRRQLDTNVNNDTAVDGMSITIQATGRPVMLLFSGEFQNSSGGTQVPRPTLRRDGTTIGTISGQTIPDTEAGQVVGVFVDQAPPAGELTYAPFWDGSGDGTGSTFLEGGNTDIVFSVYEL